MADMNPWKLTSIGLVVVGLSVGVTAFVMGGKNAADNSAPGQQTAAQETAGKPRHKATPVQHSQPPESIVLACNKQAEDQVADKTQEIMKDADYGVQELAPGAPAASRRTP